MLVPICTTGLDSLDVSSRVASPSCGKVCSSPGSEMPLWFVSCHRRSDEKIASRWSTTSSPFPPFSVLSYSVRARKPFFSSPAGGPGCGVKLPKSSCPLSIVPLPLRSKVSQASSEPEAVQERPSGVPSLFMSNSTPAVRSVKLNPLPNTSMTIGEEFPSHWQWSKFQARPWPQTCGAISQYHGSPWQLFEEKFQYQPYASHSCLSPQHSPAVGAVPGGQLPLKPGVVQLPPAIVE